ncbi:MAG: cysteine hydrolase [Pseudomonadota bacterium]
MNSEFHLLVIDPQNDFCDLPAAYRPSDTAPALPVPGAHADMQRVAELLRRGGRGVSGVSITMDAHHRFDIAHPPFWTGADGAAVPPFTQISAAAVRSGIYLPRQPDALPRVLAYLDALETGGRYGLMVWPVHCEIGSWGQQVHADVRAACDEWEAAGHRLNLVEKGGNQWTEHYSAVMAEVPDVDDPTTQLNQTLIDVLAASERVYITGEAGSHCVKATTEHIADCFRPDHIAKLVLVTDCISPVTGFERQYQDFIDAMRQRGVRIAQSAQVLDELIANSQ